MQEKDNEVMAVPEIEKLMNELTYRKYVLSHEQIRGFFQELSIPDYVALYIIRETAQSADIYSGRTYLKDLAEKMRMTIRQTSKMVGKLRDRGLLTWSHDGNGSEGTYVTATELGLELLSQQENALTESDRWDSPSRSHRWSIPAASLRAYSISPVLRASLA